MTDAGLILAGDGIRQHPTVAQHDPALFGPLGGRLSPERPVLSRDRTEVAVVPERVIVRIPQGLLQRRAGWHRQRLTARVLPVRQLHLHRHEVVVRPVATLLQQLLTGGVLQSTGAAQPQRLARMPCCPELCRPGLQPGQQLTAQALTAVVRVHRTVDPDHRPALDQAVPGKDAAERHQRRAVPRRDGVGGEGETRCLKHLGSGVLGGDLAGAVALTDQIGEGRHGRDIGSGHGAPGAGHDPDSACRWPR